MSVIFSSSAQESANAVPGYVADIELQTEEDLSDLLGRAEQLFMQGVLSQEGYIVF